MSAAENAQTLVNRNVRSRIVVCYGLCAIAETEVRAGQVERAAGTASTATLLLDVREPIESVQDLLDHKHITTTQIYDKRRQSARDSASHKVPI
jgi:site-specific recombinase XerC